MTSFLPLNIIHQGDYFRTIDGRLKETYFLWTLLRPTPIKASDKNANSLMASMFSAFDLFIWQLNTFQCIRV